ncbi:MAG TPA: non-homologous end-joining DNA ligase [Kineosporiaceae bacterium]|nr:non-homologous end-joining DNA ligase [Kineosporiaceae bacterium]
MAGEEEFPALVRPMLAVPGELPPAGDDAWAFEMKWDGVRTVAYVRDGGVRLMSRNDLDVTRSYPEVATPPAALAGAAAVLDGELVAFDEQGRPSFGRLQERMHVKDVAVAHRLAARVPAVLLVFDVLHLDGRSLLRTPYAERRAALAGLDLEGAGDPVPWRVPPSFRGPGADVLAASAENGLEGVVVKRLTSAYLPGRRSPDWRKVKHLRVQEVVLAGWRPGKGRRAGLPGSFVLGVQGPDGLRHAGGVGTGFTERMLLDLAGRLAPLERPTSPFAHELPRAETRDVHWVEPRLVGEVVFAEWTSDGRLRHPSWRGLRPDKRPGDVRREA